MGSGAELHLGLGVGVAPNSSPAYMGSGLGLVLGLEIGPIAVARLRDGITHGDGRSVQMGMRDGGPIMVRVKTVVARCVQCFW